MDSMSGFTTFLPNTSTLIFLLGAPVWLWDFLVFLRGADEISKIRPSYSLSATLFWPLSLLPIPISTILQYIAFDGSEAKLGVRPRAVV